MIVLVKFNKRDLEEKANEYGFVRDTLEKIYRLVEILEYLFENPQLKNRLALKGGTAINLCLLKLPRLSVDIDLDYTGNVGKESMMKERKAIKDDITTFMNTQGYEISPKTRSSHSLSSFVFAYENAGGNKDLIKVEINYSLRAHVLNPEYQNIIVDLFSASKQLRILNRIEIIAAKITALFNRLAIRDLYDIGNIIEKEMIAEKNKSLLKKLIVFYHALTAADVYSELNTDNINNFSSNHVRTDLRPVLRSDDSFNLEDTQSRVKHFLEELVVLSPKEKKFLVEFQRNKYKPDLLFSDAEILSRINNHPMAIWRTKE